LILQHIEGQLSDIDKNTITIDQLNGLVTDLGHVLLDTAQKLQGKVKIKNVHYLDTTNTLLFANSTTFPTIDHNDL
jgi:hypothetical protein